MLAAVFDVNAAKNGSCGSYILRGMQNVFAVSWFIDQLNQQDYIPGVKIGLETWRTCYSNARALQASVSLLETYITGDNASSNPSLLGMIGPSRTSEALLVSELFGSLPPHQQLPQISGSATGVALSNKTLYPNFLRVIPPDDAQIQVMIELLLELRWNYVAIVYIEDDYGITAAEALRANAFLRGICIPVFGSLPVNTKSSEFQTSVSSILTKLDGEPDSVSSKVVGVVFIGTATVAQEFTQSLGEKYNYVKVIFSEALSLQSSALSENNAPLDAAKGALVVTPQYREIPEFRQAWNRLWSDCSSIPTSVTNHSWLHELHAITGCEELRIGESEQLLYPWYHVQAAAVFAAAAKIIHTSACGGKRGPCPEFLSRLRNGQGVLQAISRTQWNLQEEFSSVTLAFEDLTDVRFRENGDVVVGTSKDAEAVYEIYNFRTCQSSQQFCFKKVGISAGGKVTLNYSETEAYAPDKTTWNATAVAQCAVGVDCDECTGVSLASGALVVPGDFYFVAFAPVHTNDPENPLKCGEVRPDLGADFVEGMLYALDKVNKPDGRFGSVLPGRKLGAIILDSCFNALSVKEKLIMLHKGFIQTPTGTQSITDILPKITGYFGGFFSVISFAMSDIITLLNPRAYVHLSPTSTSPKLSDRSELPYFMRLTVSANRQVEALLDILKAANASYVQIMYNPDDAYSVDLTQAFESEAIKRSTCVAQKVETRVKSDPTQYFRILGELRRKSSARLVIVILQYEHMIKVLGTLVDEMTADDEFLFMGTEAWARRLEVIRDRPRLSGSITLAEELSILPDFTDYFRGTDPVTSQNFWLKEYWEARGKCYFDGSFRRKEKPDECDKDLPKTFEQDPWVAYFIQAVYAFASGVGNALKNACSESVTEVCQSLTSELIVESMKQVELDLFNTGKEKPVFDSNGDGDNGYKVMQSFKNTSTGKMMYRQIGTWSVGSGLQPPINLIELVGALPADLKAKGYNSRCSSDVECRGCPAFSEASPSEETKKDELTLVPGGIIIIVLGAICLVCIVCIIVLVRRQRKSPSQPESAAPSIHFMNDVSTNATASRNRVSSNFKSIHQETVPPGFHIHLPALPGTETPPCDYEVLEHHAEIPSKPPVPCSIVSPDYIHAISSDRIMEDQRH